MALLGGCPTDVCDTPVAPPAAPGTLLDMARVALACGIVLAVTALLLTAALALRRDARPLWRRRGFALALLAGMLGAFAVAAVAWQASNHFAEDGVSPFAPAPTPGHPAHSSAKPGKTAPRLPPK